MCGLVGVLSKNTFDFSIIKEMNDQIQHRGPDDEGYLVSADVNIEKRQEKISVLKQQHDIKIALGHRRLSILDLSPLGHQPMNYLQRYWMVYNGEIYNYLELRDELVEAGYQFKSNTDSEVILAAYDKWGEACQTKFNGMWALAIFDMQENTLFLSRDRFGIKPLYYYQTEDTFIFASEIKSILKFPTVKTSPNLNYCKKVLESSSLEYKKNTAFNNIHRFNFAHYIKLNSETFFQPFKELKYWDYEVDISNEKFNQEKADKIAKEYYLLLKDAVRLRLRSDVPFGSALSGGLDSSAIVYLIEEELKSTSSQYKQETFSTVHTGDNKDCDESYYIMLITNFLGIKSNTIEPDVDEIEVLHKQVVKSWECPFVGTGMAGINTYKLINDSNVVVTLDGQGADEQQAGYFAYIVNFLYNVPLRTALKEAKALNTLPKASRYVKIGLLFNFIRHIIGRKLFGKLCKSKNMSRFLLPLNEKLKRDTFRGLINLIHYSDSRSMLYSIESRMPFMDYRLVEFTAKIPAVYKIHNGWTKYFARLAFDKKLPDEISWRKDKMGWSLPNKQWFSGPLYEWLVKTINNSEFVQKNILSVNLQENFDNIGVENSIKLLNLAVWHKEFFEENNE